MKSSPNPAELEQLDRQMTRLRQLDQEILAIEHTGPPLEDRYPEVEAELTEAEAVFISARLLSSTSQSGTSGRSAA
jgi:hypothetical protein